MWIFPLRRIEIASPVFDKAEALANAAGAFNPTGIEDAREKVLASIVRRRGQTAFRNKLLAAYGGKCAITGCAIPELLDAAHIYPYKGAETNDVRNGLLLRTDIHTLFDLGLIAVDTETWTVIVAKRLDGSEPYSNIPNRGLKVPDDASTRPSVEALDWHRGEAGM